MATEFDVAQDVLFCGLGASPVAYYRCMLPAIALDADWVGMGGDADHLIWSTGLVREHRGDANNTRVSRLPDFSRYKIIVLQQPASPAWRKLIKQLQSGGIKVVYEVDDYLHGIAHMDDHDFSPKARKKRKEKEAGAFDRKHLWEAEQTMKVCDALIASTEWIRGNYSHFNRRAYLCRNGIDLARYELTIPERESVNIGWAGATGHLKAVIPWFQQVASLMGIKPNVNFVTLGQPFANGFLEHFSEDRALAVPWAAIEQYPAAMTMFDIALAPGGSGGWYRGKSDLRWLEAGALGIPSIVNPAIYSEVEDGVTGFTAQNPMEMAEKLFALVESPKLRTEIGRNAQQHIRKKRSITVMAEQWLEVFADLLADDSR